MTRLTDAEIAAWRELVASRHPAAMGDMWAWLPGLLDEIVTLRAATEAVLRLEPDLDIGREPRGWSEAIAALATAVARG